MYALIGCSLSCQAWNRVILGAGPLGLLPGKIFEGTKFHMPGHQDHELKKLNVRRASRPDRGATTARAVGGLCLFV